MKRTAPGERAGGRRAEIRDLADLDAWLLAHDEVDDVLFSSDELQRRAQALSR